MREKNKEIRQRNVCIKLEVKQHVKTLIVTGDDNDVS